VPAGITNVGGHAVILVPDDLRVVSEEPDVQARQPERPALLLHEQPRRRVVEDVHDQADGGNMDRPALQRLMANIKAGRIDCIAVWKVDRLGQSLLAQRDLRRRRRRRETRDHASGGATTTASVLC
jgi:DNA invertase Pin-like site-specific DNA recombinase